MSEQPYTILVIDDEATTRMTLTALLDKPNYHLEMAEDGVQGIEMAKRTNPDIILLDVMMPRMNGYDVCKRIRSDPQIGEVPIIMITALDDREAKLNGLAAGADDFLSKPFDSVELEIRLRTLKRVDRYRHLVDERERLNKTLTELSEKNDQLRALSKQLMEAQETERRLVAVELHDEIGQIVTGLKLILERNNGNASDVIAEARAVTGDLFQRLRDLSLNLRPSALDDLGLFAALDVLFKRYTRQTNILVHHNVNPMNERRFDRLIETSAFRIIQEALTNVARHAGVSEVNVIITVLTGHLKVSISDSGGGFDVESMVMNTSTGLSGMAERVNMTGGTFILRSKPGEGTIVHADFELKEGA